MKIVCKIRREGGTKVKMPGGVEYHFKPDTDGEHIASVTDEKHIALFLRVSDAYMSKGEVTPEPEDTTVADDLAVAYPLADIEVGTLKNKDLMNVAKEHLGFRGTNKDDLIKYAEQRLGLAGYGTDTPKATYIDLLRGVVEVVAKRQREEKLAEMQADLAAEGRSDL